MTLKKAAAMAAVLLCAVVLLWRSSRGVSPGGNEAKFDPASVTSIDLRRPGGSGRFERKPGAEWELAQPLGAPADTTAVEELIRYALALQAGSAFAAADAPDARETYGLEHPDLELELHSGSQTALIRFGKLNKLSKRRYAELNGPGYRGAGVIFLIPEAQFTKLNKTRDDLRERRPLRLDAKAVRALTVRRRLGELVLERSTDDDWSVIEGQKTYPADALVTEELVRKLTALRAEGFADDFNESVSADFGLDRPILSFSFRLAPGIQASPGVLAHQTPAHRTPELNEVTVEVGRVLGTAGPAQASLKEQQIIPDLERRYYFRVIGSPWVYRAGLAGPLDDLLKEANFFRERCPFAGVKGLSSFKLTVAGSESIELKKREAGFVVRKGVQEGHTSGGPWLDELLSLLGRIRVLSYNGTALHAQIRPDETLVEVVDATGRFKQVVIGSGVGREGPGAGGAPNEESPHEGYVRFGAEPPLQAMFPAQALPDIRSIAAFVEQRLSQSQ